VANFWTQNQNPTTNKGPARSGEPWTATTTCGSTPTCNALRPANCTLVNYYVAVNGGRSLGTNPNTPSYTFSSLTPSTTYTFSRLVVGQSSAATITVKTHSAGGLCIGVAAWSPTSVACAVGALVTYQGNEYKCLQTHTSQAGTPLVSRRSGRKSEPAKAGRPINASGPQFAVRSFPLRCVLGWRSLLGPRAEQGHHNKRSKLGLYRYSSRRSLRDFNSYSAPLRTVTVANLPSRFQGSGH